MKATHDELNEYLKSIGGLNSCYKPDADPIVNAYYFECGEGWFGLIKCIIEESLLLGWDKRVCQVKEKFGTLRFYVGGTPPGMDEVVHKYEKLSAKICETCGEPGEMFDDNGWYKTCCDKHRY